MEDFKERARERFAKYEANNYVPDMMRFYIEEGIKLQEEYKDIPINETRRRNDILSMIDKTLTRIPRDFSEPPTIGYIDYISTECTKPQKIICYIDNKLLLFKLSEAFTIKDILIYLKQYLYNRNHIIYIKNHIIYINHLGWGINIENENINIGLNIKRLVLENVLKDVNTLSDYKQESVYRQYHK